MNSSGIDRAASPVPASGAAATAYLDALRAIAANLVIGSHIVLVHYQGNVRYPGGSVAVSIFFLLSGFLITQSMLNRTGRPGPRLPGFLADRVARIMTPYVPALLLIVALNVWLITTHWGAPQENTGLRPFLGNLLMLQDHSVFQLLEILRHARGRFGTTLEYLLETARALRERGVRDREIERLVALARRHRLV